MKLLMVKNLNNTLSCAYDSDYDNLKKIKSNSFIEVEIKSKRNILFHRKFFALLNLVFQNQEQYTNIDHLRKDLTVSSGYYDLRYNIQGEEIKEPKSISFASMDELEFSEYYNRVIDVVVKWLGIDKQDLIDNINQYF